MSLDISLISKSDGEYFSANITHNLNKMANHLGIYECLWHPQDNNINNAGDLILPIASAIKKNGKIARKIQKIR